MKGLELYFIYLCKLKKCPKKVKMKITRFLISCFAILLSISLAYSQESGKEASQESGKETSQEQSRINRSWSLGLFGGAAGVIGDVDYNSGYGIGLNIQKSLTTPTLLRFQFTYGMASGLSGSPSFGDQINRDDAINGTNDPLINYKGQAQAFKNYRMDYMDLSVQVVYNFAFGDYRSTPNPKYNLFGFIGGGGLWFSTMVDQWDNSASNIYNYSMVATAGKDKKAIKSDVEKILDGNYETPAQGNPQGNGKATGMEFMNGSLVPGLFGGLGVKVKLTDRLDFHVEGRTVYPFNDLLDGNKWEINGSESSSNDLLLGLNAGINLRIGRKENIYWFDNPHSMHYKVTLENKRKIDMLTKDTDGDGVPDYFDKDPYTPSGIAVDGAGRALDVDGDGIPDYMDKDPFTAPGAIVDEHGRPLDSDKDGVPDYLDLEPNTPEGMIVNFQGKAIASLLEARSQGGLLLDKDSQTPTPIIPHSRLGFIPVVYFDFGKYFVKPLFYVSLHQMAGAIQYNPDVKIILEGHTDTVGSAEFNYQLGLNRAQAVADILIQYGVPESRLEIISKGKTEQIEIIGAGDQARQNRRVIIKVAEGGKIIDELKINDPGRKDMKKVNKEMKDDALFEELKNMDLDKEDVNLDEFEKLLDE
jgi:outer membrane protein OmpA-like peptidoglycan-associated protein